MVPPDRVAHLRRELPGFEKLRPKLRVVQTVDKGLRIVEGEASVDPGLLGLARGSGRSGECQAPAIVNQPGGEGCARIGAAMRGQLSRPFSHAPRMIPQIVKRTRGEQTA